MKFLRELMFEHLLSKLFAVLFAIIVVVLVERELGEFWIDGDKELEVVQESKNLPTTTNHRVVLRPETGVAVITHPRTLRLELFGSKKDLADFSKDYDCISVVVKKSWAESSRPVLRQRVLVRSDFRIGGYSGVEVELKGDAKDHEIQVDLFDEIKNVPVVLNNPPPNWDPALSSIQPKTVDVRGPRHWLRHHGFYDPEFQWKVHLDSAERFPRAGQYPAKPLPDYALHQLTAHASESGGPALEECQVRLELKSEFQELSVEGLRIAWAVEDIKEVSQGRVRLNDQTVMIAKVVLKVPSADYGKWATTEGLQMLRRDLQLQIEPAEEIAKSTEPRSVVSLPVQVYRLPPGWGLKQVDPAEIDVIIERKN